MPLNNKNIVVVNVSREDTSSQKARLPTELPTFSILESSGLSTKLPTDSMYGSSGQPNL